MSTRKKKTTPTAGPSLASLRQMQDDIRQAEAEVRMLRGQFEVAVGKRIRASGVSLSTSALCLQCGSIVPANESEHQCVSSSL